MYFAVSTDQFTLKSYVAVPAGSARSRSSTVRKLWPMIVQYHGINHAFATARRAA